jgi:hypothetical protein
MFLILLRDSGLACVFPPINKKINFLMKLVINIMSLGNTSTATTMEDGLYKYRPLVSGLSAVWAPYGHQHVPQVLCGILVARYPRWPLQYTRRRPASGEGGEAIEHKASCPPFAPFIFHPLLLWRTSGSQIFCVQYKRASKNRRMQRLLR